MSDNGLLKLIVFDKDCPNDSQAFYLPSKSEGWAEAEKLISALQAWVNLSKGI